ncbi:PQQ-dependent sugar dehydrogenase [Acidobacteria bacterium AH-259-O06]|nr:PQQ-dependent sugar dehydrogenase [Acidobacteria bacterium AH-259-O06]
MGVYRPSLRQKFDFGGFLLLGISFLASLLAQPAIKLRPVVSGLDRPVYVTHSGDGSGRLFIVEQAGLIFVYQAGRLFPDPFLDIRAKVNWGGEKGLLGLAFHPNFESNHRFFINYTRLDGQQLKTVVAEYRASASDPNLADPTERVLLELDQPFANHNGGHLDFGPDGYLYISTGDGGSAADPFDNAQNRASLLGKILRIDIDSESPYAIPADNPFVGQPDVREEIWAYGLRNPWRFSFDPPTGRIFAGDVGQNSWEEVDIVLRGGNYGWNIQEGAHCFPPSVRSCSTAGLIQPIAEYSRAEGISVIAGYVYRGSQPTDFRAAYIFGDFGSGRMWALQETASGGWIRTELLETGFPISSFGVDDRDEIYVVDYGGAVFQIEFPSRQFFAHVADGISPAGTLKTTFILVNQSEDSVAGEIRLYDSSGSSLEVESNGVRASRFPFVLAAKSSGKFETEGNSDPLATGWGEVISDRPIETAILYTLFAPSGEPIAEAGVSASDKKKAFTARVSRGSAFDLNTGVAVANPSTTENAQITFVLKDQNGEAVTSSSIVLGPLKQTARFLQELATVPADFEGTLLIASTEDIAVVLLRTKRGLQLSSIPVAGTGIE